LAARPELTCGIISIVDLNYPAPPFPPYPIIKYP
jgi:hypothetical protein